MSRGPATNFDWPRPWPLFALAMVLASIFALLWLQVIVGGPMITADHAVHDRLAGLRDGDLNWLFEGLSLLGSLTGGAILCGLAGILFYRQGLGRACVAPLLVFGFTVVSFSAVKWFTQRPRPEDMAPVIEASSSFPSGSSAIAVVVFATLAYLALAMGRNRAARWAPVLLALALITLVAFSRLYLGVHYLSDVIAGAALGTFWATLAAAALAQKSREAQGRG